MTFTVWLVKKGVVDGPSGLGRLAKEFRNRDRDGYDNRILAFVGFLKQRYPEDWMAYQTYNRLTGE